MGLCARFVRGGALGLLVCLSLRFSTCSLAGWGVGLSGCSGEVSVFCGGVFGFGNELFGAAYHLHDEYHIFNIFGVMMRGE